MWFKMYIMYFATVKIKENYKLAVTKDKMFLHYLFATERKLYIIL